MRGFWANWIASQARSMSRSLHRARPQTDEPVTSAAMARTASKSPTEAIGKPGLDDVDAERGQRPGHLELLGHVHARARRLLAVAQGRVEDPDPVRLGLRCRRGRILGLGRAHESALSSVLRGWFKSHGSRRRIRLPACAARMETRGSKKEAPRSTWRAGLGASLACIPVRSRRTLRYPPRPADKAKAKVKSKVRRQDSHPRAPNAVALHSHL